MRRFVRERIPFRHTAPDGFSYASDAPGDFTAQDNITKRLIALIEKGETIRQLAHSEQVAPIAGLTQPEMTVMATLAGSVGTPDGKASVHLLQQYSERAGLTKLGIALGIRRLRAKKLVESMEDSDYNGETYEALTWSEAGWDWIEANEDKFILRKEVAVTDDDLR